MAQDKKEIEIKAIVDRAELDFLLRQPWLQKLLRPGGGRVLHIVSTYYDTPSGAFRRNGVAYRVRDKGDGTYEATAKRTLKKEGGLSRRLELNRALLDLTPLLTGCAELGLGLDLSELAAKEGGIEPLFTVEVDRTLYVIEEGTLTAELAVDRGSITTPAGQREAIDEVELELMKGSEEDLQKLFARIAETVPLKEEERSKFARGLTLREKEKSAK